MLGRSTSARLMLALARPNHPPCFLQMELLLNFIVRRPPWLFIYLFIFPHGLILSSGSWPVGSPAVGSRVLGSKWTWHGGSKHTNALHRCWQFNKWRSSAPAPSAIRDAQGSNLPQLECRNQSVSSVSQKVIIITLESKNTGSREKYIQLFFSIKNRKLYLYNLFLVFLNNSVFFNAWKVTKSL